MELGQICSKMGVLRVASRITNENFPDETPLPNPAKEVLHGRACALDSYIADFDLSVPLSSLAKGKMNTAEEAKGKNEHSERGVGRIHRI